MHAPKRMTSQKQLPWRRALAFFAVLALCLGMSLYSHSERLTHKEMDRDFDKLEPTLRAFSQHAGYSERQSMPVIVQFAEPEAPEGAEGAPALLDDGDMERMAQQRAQVIYLAGGEPMNALSNAPLHTARVTPEALRRLANHPMVRHISIDHPVQGNLDITTVAIGADQAWLGTRVYHGVTGNGITVAVLDSGTDVTNEVLAGRISASVDFTGEGNTNDGYGHGTHVAGIIGGVGKYSQVGYGFTTQYKGIAPASKLINLKVLDSSGSGLTSNVIAALNWCMTNRAKYKIGVINLSLGHPVFESYKTDPLCQAVEACVKAGMVVVASAGNFGKNLYGQKVYGGITSPGNDPMAITVGAVNTFKTPKRSDDAIANYSSRGPTPVDGLIKPDIVAPGNAIVAAEIPSAKLVSDYPQNVVASQVLTRYKTRTPGQYFSLSGTSMAAAVVSGTVALMYEANQYLGPNSVKVILNYTAERMTQPNILEQGDGYLNAFGAVRLCQDVITGYKATPDGGNWLGTLADMIQPKDTIASQAIPWGDAILWGDGRAWGDGIKYVKDQSAKFTDPAMTKKQPAFVEAILWRDGKPTADGIVLGSRVIYGFGAKVGTQGLLSLTSDKWDPNFVNPMSMSDSEEDILINGENGVLPSLGFGTPGSWYYPVRQQHITHLKND